MREPSRLVVAALVGGAVLAIDQMTKSRIVADLRGQPALTVIDPWFRLEYAENRGIAFGMLPGSRWLLAAVALAVLVLVAVHVRDRWYTSWLVVVGAAMVFSGAIANAWDRLRFGHVVDYIAIGAWPNFNVADTAISVGIVLLVVDALLHPHPRIEAQHHG